MARYKLQRKIEGGTLEDVKLDASSVDLSSCVKTVNNTSPDANGNVNVSAGVGTITGVQLNGSTIASSGVANVKALPNYSLSISTGSGNPREVKFVRVNYSTFDENNAAYFKIGAMCSHGNGSSYTFLEDIIIGVSATPSVTCTIYKQVQNATTYTIDSHTVHFGDVYWVVNTTDKYVDFYIIGGQYATLMFTPFTRIGNTVSDTSKIVQYTSANYYSSGTRVWNATGNSSLYARTSDIPSLSGYLQGSKYNASNPSTFIGYNAAENANSHYQVSFKDDSDAKGICWSKFGNVSNSVMSPSACTYNGFFYVSSTNASLSGADSNPFTGSGLHTSANDFRILTTAHSDQWLQQIATDFRSDYVFVRRRENGTWQNWTQVAPASTQLQSITFTSSNTLAEVIDKMEELDKRMVGVELQCSSNMAGSNSYYMRIYPSGTISTSTVYSPTVLGTTKIYYCLNSIEYALSSGRSSPQFNFTRDPGSTYVNTDLTFKKSRYSSSTGYAMYARGKYTAVGDTSSFTIYNDVMLNYSASGAACPGTLTIYYL